MHLQATQSVVRILLRFASRRIKRAQSRRNALSQYHRLSSACHRSVDKLPFHAWHDMTSRAFRKTMPESLKEPPPQHRNTPNATALPTPQHSQLRNTPNSATLQRRGTNTTAARCTKLAVAVVDVAPWPRRRPPTTTNNNGHPLCLQVPKSHLRSHVSIQKSILPTVQQTVLHVPLYTVFLHRAQRKRQGGEQRANERTASRLVCG